MANNCCIQSATAAGVHSCRFGQGGENSPGLPSIGDGQGANHPIRKTPHLITEGLKGSYAQRGAKKPE